MEYVNFLISEKENAMDNEKNQDYGIPKTTFQNLSDEITLKILSYVNVKDLFRCMAVNKKMRAIANDKSLWISWHLTGEFPAELLKQILNRGCQHLSLYSCKIWNTARFEENYDLKYLNIYNCSVGTFDPFYCLEDQ